MTKKIFFILTILNLSAYIWQSMLSISLSTKGDILTQKLLSINQIQNDIDLLEYNILKSTSLDNAQLYAQKLNFTPINFTNFVSDSLADAKSKTSL